MGAIKDRMIEDLRLGGYVPSTHEHYLRHAEKFVAHFMKPADRAGGRGRAGVSAVPRRPG